VISAIAIASLDPSVKAAAFPAGILKYLRSTYVQDKPMAAWPLEDWLDLGSLQYSNSKVSFTSLPPALFGAQWMRAQDTGDATAGITISEEADVYIGLDKAIEQRPSWLQDYEDTKTIFSNSQGRTFQVYRKRFAKNSNIIFGPNENIQGSRASIYTVFLVAANKMEPAYDLKPVTSYKAIAAQFKGPGISKGQVDGKERVIFTKASAQNVLEWNMTVGVADIYSLTITYNNPHQQVINGKLEFFAADGTLMKTEEVEFTPTRAGKSNYINSSTGSMVNAGNYKVRLTSAKAQNISINALDVQ
jgi:hypothetical protein